LKLDACRGEPYVFLRHKQAAKELNTFNEKGWAEAMELLGDLLDDCEDGIADANGFRIAWPARKITGRRLYNIYNVYLRYNLLGGEGNFQRHNKEDALQQIEEIKPPTMWRKSKISLLPVSAGGKA
jgi:hypothetical protein